MKKEIGKWFMDVAKYIATAVLLTQIFGGMADSVYIIVFALISVIIIFLRKSLEVTNILPIFAASEREFWLRR